MYTIIENMYSGKFHGINVKLEERGYTAVDISQLGEGYIHMVTQGADEYVPSTSLEDNENKVATIAEREEAGKLKINGNNCIQKGKYHSAIYFYSKAIKLDNKNAVLYANRAAARSQLSNHEEAIQDCERAIALDPSYSKAYCRMGLAFFSLKEYKLAVKYYEEAVMLEPNNSSFIEKLENAKKVMGMNK